MAKSCHEMLGDRIEATEHWCCQYENEQKYFELAVMENHLQIMRALRKLVAMKIVVED